MSATFSDCSRRAVIDLAKAILATWEAVGRDERLALIRELRHQARRLPGGSDRRSVLLALEWIDNDGFRKAA